MLLDQRIHQSDGEAMMQRALSNARQRVAIILAILFGAAVLLAAAVRTGHSSTEEVSYTKNIAPILQRKCQACHQPGSIAPMSLLTYEDAKDNLTEMKERVSARVMPPWHIDRTVGIQRFKNDGGLTDAEIATIMKWINDGAPKGDPKDLPPAPKATD